MDPSFIVSKKDSSEELLLIVIENLEVAGIFLNNLKLMESKENTVKLEFSNSNSSEMIFIFKIPKNHNIYSKLLDKTYFQNHRDIILLGKKILEYLKEDSDYISMKDINSRNIFLDKENKPKFLFMSSTPDSEDKSSIDEKVFALGILIYTISQKNEPFFNQPTKLTKQILGHRLKLKKDTPKDIVNIIKECVTFSSSTSSLDSLYDSFLKIAHNPNLDLMEDDQDLIPISGSFSVSIGEISPISLSMLIIYPIALLIGCILFCVLKKPLEEQQRTQPINPMMNGLNQAERNLQAMQGNQNVQDPLVGP